MPDLLGTVTPTKKPELRFALDGSVCKIVAARGET
jgi:hypothetical protein